jgi:hypothetical protein
VLAVGDVLDLLVWKHVVEQDMRLDTELASSNGGVIDEINWAVKTNEVRPRNGTKLG